jgi:hypothetical protein
MEDVAAYWFNRGCYHWQLGDLEDAKSCVRRAVDLDKSFQQMALDDEDLEPLWDRAYASELRPSSFSRYLGF